MNTKKKKKQQPFNLRKWLIIASFLMSFACVDPTTSNAPCRDVEQFANIKLPPSYENLQSNCGAWQGMWAEIYFEMSPDDLAYFLSNLWLPPELSIEGDLHILDDFADIDLATVESYLYSYTYSDSVSQELFIDTSNPERYRVYLLILAG